MRLPAPESRDDAGGPQELLKVGPADAADPDAAAKGLAVRRALCAPPRAHRARVVA